MKSLLLDSPRATLRFHDLPGSGAPLVFVHGLGCACDNLRPIAGAGASEDVGKGGR